MITKIKSIASILFSLTISITDSLAYITYIVARSMSQGKKNSVSILHISNLAHKPSIIRDRLRLKGVDVDYLALNIDWTYLNLGKKSWDYSLESTDKGHIKYYLNRFFLLWFVCTRYDMIHVHCQSFFTSNMQEYFYLKRLGKKFIFHFRGCDIRRKSESNGFFPDLNCCQECDYPDGSCDNEQQKIYLKTVRELGNAFFCTTPDLLPFCPPGTKYLPFTSPPEEFIREIKPAIREKDIFRVVTSSNHDGVDGTQYVRDAVNRLKSEGHKIELVELRKTPYREALSIYASADVYAGKLRMGFYNNANIECMMLGIPCMSFIRPEFREKYCPDCPIIQATPNTIYDVLKHYITKPDELSRIGKLGPDFVRKYHSEDKTIIPLIECYQELMNRKIV